MNNCPICGKEGEGCFGEVWDSVFNQETRFYECPEGHKFSVVQEYKPFGEPFVMEDWDDMPNYANEFGRYYIGAYKGGKFLAYSEDGVSFGDCVQWGFYTTDCQELGRMFTRMNIEQANKQIKTINEQHPELNCFLIRAEDAEMWGIARR